MSQIAHEVSRRMTPGYAKERARDMARDRMSRARESAVESSWFAPLVGAGIGALVAKALQSRAQERSWQAERYGRGGELRGRGDGYGYPRGADYSGYAVGYEEYDAYGAEAGFRETGFPEEGRGAAESGGSGLGERASEMKDRARGSAEELKGRARGAAEELKGRARGAADDVRGRLDRAASSARDRLPDAERIRESARQDTGMWALGAVALGALFGFAIPETRRERELLEPARRKARELGHEAKERALEKGTEALEQATEKVESAGREQRPQGETGSAEPPTAIH